MGQSARLRRDLPRPALEATSYAGECGAIPKPNPRKHRLQKIQDFTIAEGQVGRMKPTRETYDFFDMGMASRWCKVGGPDMPRETWTEMIQAASPVRIMRI